MARASSAFALVIRLLGLPAGVGAARKKFRSLLLLFPGDVEAKCHAYVPLFVRDSSVQDETQPSYSNRSERRLQIYHGSARELNANDLYVVSRQLVWVELAWDLIGGRFYGL